MHRDPHWPKLRHHLIKTNLTSFKMGQSNWTCHPWHPWQCKQKPKKKIDKAISLWYWKKKRKEKHFPVHGTKWLIKKGHLCLWWEDSLTEKCNTKYFKIIFLFNFPCMQVSFDGQKHTFWLFLLCLRPHTSAGMNIKDALFQYILIMASYWCSFFFFSQP